MYNNDSLGMIRQLNLCLVFPRKCPIKGLIRIVCLRTIGLKSISKSKCIFPLFLKTRLFSYVILLYNFFPTSKVM